MATFPPVIYDAAAHTHRVAISGADTINPALLPINSSLVIMMGVLGVNTAALAPSFLPATAPVETEDSAIPTKHVGGSSQYLGTPAAWITVQTGAGPRAVPCYIAS